ncbi:DivIVA domain-containing protein [Streptomyces zingiberis]|uniref:DivIVA domain-containing protein n=1 Tax=Streptomyces zingiberis TaxID=2053010 RepID=UPI0035D4C1CD
MFWFLLIALVAVVAAVTLAVVGGDDGAALPEAEPDRLADPLPPSRPVGRADVEAVRFAVTARGYRMADVDEVLSRLGAELAERDARIAELETALAGNRATGLGSPELFRRPAEPDPERDERDERVERDERGEWNGLDPRAGAPAGDGAGPDGSSVLPARRAASPAPASPEGEEPQARPAAGGAETPGGAVSGGREPGDPESGGPAPTAPTAPGEPPARPGPAGPAPGDGGPA